MNIDDLNDRVKQFCTLEPEHFSILQLGSEEREVLIDEVSSLGYNLSPGDDAIISLGLSQFRSDNSGRGLGMKAVLGDEVLRSLLEMCAELPESEASRIVKNDTDEPIDGTQGRGLQQGAADIVSFMVLPNEEDRQEAILRLNKRVWRYWIKKANAKKISAAEFAPILAKAMDAGLGIPSDKMASANPNHLWNVWLFLTGSLSD